MPNVFSKLPEMPYEPSNEPEDGDIQYGPNNWFRYQRDIWKPLPPPILSFLRQSQNKKIVKGWLKEEIRAKTSNAGIYSNQKKELTDLKAVMLELQPEMPTGYTQVITPDETSSLPTGSRIIGIDGVNHHLKQITYNFKDVNLQALILSLVYNDKKQTYKNNRKEARTKCQKLKLLYSQRLEYIEDSPNGFKICDASGEEVVYHGAKGKEQNYIKAAEALQENCNMIENMFDIFER